MICVVCDETPPRDNYAVVDGNYYCLVCFIENYQDSLSRKNSSRRKSSISSTKTKSLVERHIPPIALRSDAVDVPRSHIQIGTSSSNVLIRDPPSVYLPAMKNDRSCQVCLEEKSSRCFNAVPDHRCHEIERTICDGCLYLHISQAFHGVFTVDVRCPELSCGRVFIYETIKQILLHNNNQDLFDKYDKFICRNSLEQMEEFIWCSNPKCAMGQLNAGGTEQNIVTCLRCKHKTCFVHKIPWHQGMSCDEYETKTDPNAQASLKWITQNTKQCPQCSYRIEKDDGCDHMTCTRCHHEFCWACLADFNPIRQDGNHRHDPGCKHYAAYEKA